MAVHTLTSSFVLPLVLAVYCLGFETGFAATFEAEADRAAIKQHVDEAVMAINQGTPIDSFAADSFKPYLFVIDAQGKVLVHPTLTGEFLQEKAAPVYAALEQATTMGSWVTYYWKGEDKASYVRRTIHNDIVGSGF